MSSLNPQILPDMANSSPFTTIKMPETSPEYKPRGFFHFFLMDAFNPFILILWASATVSFVSYILQNELGEGVYEGVVLFVAVFLSIAASSTCAAWQQVECNKKLCQLSDYLQTDGSLFLTSCRKCKPSPLREEANRLASIMAKVGFLAALFVLIVLLANYFRRSEIQQDKFAKEVAGIVVATATVVEMAILEGLMPIGSTLVLFCSMKKMMSGEALVRELSACETMGSATVACFNKTGTLTTNQMKVTESWLGNRLVAEKDYSSVEPKVRKLTGEGVALNTRRGNPTDEALLSLVGAHDSGNMEQSRQNCKILCTETFNSEKKRSGVLFEREADNTTHVHWKGAPETVLGMSSTYYDKNGTARPLGRRQKGKLKKRIQRMEEKSLRCIAFAHLEVAEEELQEVDLTFLGVVGIENLCRQGVNEAMEALRGAGLSLIMMTGDSVGSAKATARECGILLPDEETVDGAVVEGEKFRNYSSLKQSQVAPKIRVMARCSPDDKKLLVECLKKEGDVVALIGDGTNNAAALKEAHIGVFVGIQATKVAQESSDIIISDDDFSSTINALRWGRSAYNDILKLYQVRFTMIVVAMAINVLAAWNGEHVPPMKASFLCWAELIMSVLGFVGFVAKNYINAIVQERPPIEQIEAPISVFMWSNAIKAFYQIVVLVLLRFRISSADATATDFTIYDTLLVRLFEEICPAIVQQILRNASA